MRRRTVVAFLAGAVLWGAAAARAAEAPASGQWTGTSTGNAPECNPHTFTLEVRDGKVIGRATSPSRSGHLVEWELSGQVTADNQVEVVSRTANSGVRAARQAMTWVGQLSGDQLVLSQPRSIGCTTPRTVTLTRR